MKIKKFIAAMLMVISAGTFAQTPHVLTQPGLKKLGVFVGKWKSENTTKDAPKNFWAITTCRWSVNGNYLIADQEVHNNGVVTNNLAIYSYDAKTDTYKLSLVGVPNMAPFAIPVLASGDQFIYPGSYTDNNGKKVYTRTLNNFISSSLYTYQVQSSTDSVHWTSSLEGRTSRITAKQ
jgi:hypothetical protein